jgi:hypothetical protein
MEKTSGKYRAHADVQENGLQLSFLKSPFSGVVAWAALARKKQLG